MEWLIKAAGTGNYSSCGLLTDIYAKGLFGFARNPEKAQYWEAMCSKQRET
jgi:TPR repeat protein